MANPEHLRVVKQGAKALASWREDNPSVRLALDGADLSGVDLRGARLRNADLRGANLANALLGRASLAAADLEAAELTGADLGRASLAGASHLTWRRRPRAALRWGRASAPISAWGGR